VKTESRPATHRRADVARSDARMSRARGRIVEIDPIADPQKPAGQPPQQGHP
jgi:hypothetical protein